MCDEHQKQDNLHGFLSVSLSSLSYMHQKGVATGLLWFEKIQEGSEMLQPFKKGLTHRNEEPQGFNSETWYLSDYKKPPAS